MDYVITNREIRLKKVKDSKSKKEYMNNFKYYEYSCNICGAKNLWKIESKIYINICSCCSGRTRIRGINTIGDLHPQYVKYFENDDAFNPSLSQKDYYNIICPICKSRHNTLISNLVQGKFYCKYCNSFKNKRPDLMKYLVNKEDGENSFSSYKEVLTKCINCGNERKMRLGNLSFQGFNCPKCSDRVSYAERFLINIFSQLEIDYIYQASNKIFNWCKKYKYDFYIPPSIIIETHGIQHYEDSFSRMGGMNAKENQENDQNKKDLAIKNGIKYYIVLDCRKSNYKWIKESIYNSDLKYFLDLEKINWKKCAEDSNKNIVKEVCEYYNNNKLESCRKIASVFNLEESTIRKYLKKGESLSWCNYSQLHNKDNQKKKVAIYRDNKLIANCDSISNAVSFIKKIIILMFVRLVFQEIVIKSRNIIKVLFLVL